MICSWEETCDSIVSVFSAACGIFGLASGGFKCQGIILIELMQRYPQYDEATLLWVFTVGSVLMTGLGKRQSCNFRLSQYVP